MGGVQRGVGTGDDDDAVFASAVQPDHRHAGAVGDGFATAAVNVQAFEVGAQFTASAVVAKGADEVGRCAAFGGGDGLVGTFAAVGAVVALAVQGFACLGKGRHLRDVVDVAAAKDEKGFHARLLDGWFMYWGGGWRR